MSHELKYNFQKRQVHHGFYPCELSNKIAVHLTVMLKNTTLGLKYYLFTFYTKFCICPRLTDCMNPPIQTFNELITSSIHTAHTPIIATK